MDLFSYSNARWQELIANASSSRKCGQMNYSNGTSTKYDQSAAPVFLVSMAATSNKFQEAAANT
jgi:phage baseplate assembly protein gpV